MLYSRVCLLAALLAGISLTAPTAQAQAKLPAVLRGESAPPPPDAPGASAWRVPLPDVLNAPFEAAAQSNVAGDLPQAFAALSASTRSLRDSLVALARAQIGRPYRFGGTTPKHGFDCSGLVRYVMAALHVALPRTAKDQARSGEIVARDTSQLLPGDLVTFGSTRHISHIGIYVGGGRFVQASSKAGRVIETPLNRRPAPGVKPWRGARRVMPDDSTSAGALMESVPDRGDAG